MDEKLDALIEMVYANMRISMQILACVADNDTTKVWMDAFDNSAKAIEKMRGNEYGNKEKINRFKQYSI